MTTLPFDGTVVGIATDDELRSLFALSPALHCIAGADGYFKRVNPAFTKTLGYTEPELLARPFIEFVHPDDRESTLREVLNLSTGISAVHFDNRYRHANGSYRRLLWNANPVPEQGLMYATAFDITEKKHADMTNQVLLDTIPDSVIVTDHEGKILRANPATEILFAYSPDELVGLSIEVLIPVRFRDKHRQHRSVYAKNPRPRLMGEGTNLVGLRKDGSEFPAEISLGTTESGADQTAICVVRDISAKEKRENDLELSKRQILGDERQLQALAARLTLAEENERRRIARDLHDDVGQTLLAAKLSLDELLHDGLSEDKNSSAREAQELVQNAIRSMRSLIFDVSSAALYDVGLGAALQSLCERAERQSDIRFQPPENVSGTPIPESKRVILYRAGRELIHNIVKHSQARTAKLSLAHSGNFVKLTVEDDGRGFDVASVRGGNARKGFGLFSIDQQLRPIGGKLETTSTPGSGTCVELIVPIDGGEETI